MLPAEQIVRQVQPAKHVEHDGYDADPGQQMVIDYETDGDADLHTPPLGTV